jgi:hypothetical protein
MGARARPRPNLTNTTIEGEHSLTGQAKQARNEEVQQMPYRHWFVVVTVDGVESRTGPYVSRRMAERKCFERHKNGPNADVKLIYDDTAPRGLSRRDRRW